MMEVDLDGPDTGRPGDDPDAQGTSAYNNGAGDGFRRAPRAGDLGSLGGKPT
jgi:hypothetical protein